MRGTLCEPEVVWEQPPTPHYRTVRLEPDDIAEAQRFWPARSRRDAIVKYARHIAGLEPTPLWFWE